MSRSQNGSLSVSKAIGTVVPKSAVFDEDKNVSSFIGKLSLMLQDPTAQPYVCWSATGESILIIDPPRFSSQILPRYFKHSNFASFVRQLNLYGFHKTSQESDSCEFSHPIFRKGNEQTFKDIRRKVATQSSFQERDSSKSRSEMERMMQSIEDLQSRQAEFEKALEQKEAEKLLIYQEMIQSKHRQDVLEARMSRMVGVLMQACHSIGLTQIEGDGGSNLLQILDCETSDSIRVSKRQRLLENAPVSSGIERALSPGLDGFKFQNTSDVMNSIHSDSMANDLLDALSAKLSSVSGHRDKFRAVGQGSKFRSFSKPTLEDVTDSCSARAADVPLGQWDSCSPRQAGLGQWEGAISIGSLRDSCESPCEVVTHPWDVPNPCEGWSTVLGSREGCVSEGVAADLGLHESLEISAGLGSHLGSAGDEISASAYSFDPSSACDPVAASAFASAQGSELLHQPCPGAPSSPRSSHADLEGEHGSALLLSPRGFDSLDGLPTENLNSIELNLGSQSFNLDSFLGGDPSIPSVKKEPVV